MKKTTALIMCAVTAFFSVQVARWSMSKRDAVPSTHYAMEFRCWNCGRRQQTQVRLGVPATDVVVTCAMCGNANSFFSHDKQTIFDFRAFARSHTHFRYDGHRAAEATAPAVETQTAFPPRAGWISH